MKKLVLLLALTACVGCTTVNPPTFFYRERVVVVDDFYKGTHGTVIERYGDYYLVEFDDGERVFIEVWKLENETP